MLLPNLAFKCAPFKPLVHGALQWRSFCYSRALLCRGDGDGRVKGVASWRRDQPKGPRASSLTDALIKRKAVRTPWDPSGETRLSHELLKLRLEDFSRTLKAGPELDREGNSEVVFGVAPCLLALAGGRRKAHRLFVKGGDIASQREAVQGVCEEAKRQGVQIQRTTRKVLDEMSHRRVHQGLCLEASPLGYLTEEQTEEPPGDTKTPLWLVLDGVQDPMNLGAVLRSAYFLGVDRVACSLRNSCPLTPVVSKASSGVMEIMGVYGYQSLAEMVKTKASEGWLVVGTVGAGNNDADVPVLSCSDFLLTTPTLLLMGGEGAGLSPELTCLCSVLLTIHPRRELHPAVESLNVSVATGILLHSLLSSRGPSH